MTTEFQAGRLLMVDIPGQSLDADTAAFLREHQIRAVCLFRRNLGTESRIRQLTADLRDVMGEHALIAIDQEGGSVVRALSLPHAPSAMALGAADDDALCEQVGAAVARGLRHLGLNWNFAPVLDVNNNPQNPVIAERSFGSDPRSVARLASAWMRGSHAEGVACCVKHFPGHGDTHVDSHLALPVVEKSMAELKVLELLPFHLIGAEAPSLMTAHIVYPKIDPGHPATLSERFLNGLLRGEMGYPGVVITDALMMRAVHDLYGHGRAAVLALKAGADMPLAQGTREEQLATLQAVRVAIEEGLLELPALQQSVARLDALATRFPASPQDLRSDQRAADELLMRQAWARALASVGAPQPPRRDRPLRVVTQASVESNGVSEAGLSAQAVRALFAGFNDVQFVEVANLRAASPAVLNDVDGRTTVLVSNHRPRYAQSGAMQPALHLVLWNPFQVLDVPAPAVVTWGHADGALAALKDWLEGRAPAPGIPPVALG